MLKPGAKSLELLAHLQQVGTALKTITDDPEGGTLTLNIEETGQSVVFTMPPLKDRKK